MHVSPNDTHPLSLILGPMGDKSSNASVEAHDMSLENSMNHGVWYVSQYIVSIVARNTSQKWYILLSHNIYHNHVSEQMEMICSHK